MRKSWGWKGDLPCLRFTGTETCTKKSSLRMIHSRKFIKTTSSSFPHIPSEVMEIETVFLNIFPFHFQVLRQINHISNSWERRFAQEMIFCRLPWYRVYKGQNLQLLVPIALFVFISGHITSVTPCCQALVRGTLMIKSDCALLCQITAKLSPTGY